MIRSLIHPRFSFLLYLPLFIMQACSTAGPGLFNKKTPHDLYADKLKTAGLTETALGKSWLEEAEKSLLHPLLITLPYKETGYFPADKPSSASLSFKARRGENVVISLEKRPGNHFQIYLDLWKVSEAVGKMPKFLAAADSSGMLSPYEIEEDAEYILRLQPELLKSGEYTLTIQAGPSIAFPVTPESKAKIGSFWGAGRDNGARSHEGIDIFSSFRTPVVAAAKGRVTRVEETLLGGKVVWVRPETKPYSLYYAHLDSQLVQAGQSVNVGDTLGLMGNTGNARTTPTHLHFGIYALGGAVDPLPFVWDEKKQPTPVHVPVSNIGSASRTGNRTKLFFEPLLSSASIPLDSKTSVHIEAASGDMYKVSLPDGNTGFVPGGQLEKLDKPIKKTTLSKKVAIYDQPDTLAPRKGYVDEGTSVNILASFSTFHFVRLNHMEGWVLKTNL